MNRKDLQALTLVGPSRDNQVLDPLAVLHLDNRLLEVSIDLFWVFFMPFCTMEYISKGSSISVKP